ncbi:MAG: hypothetical protein R3Y16_01520 [Rikenellaceae bacterium]
MMAEKNVRLLGEIRKLITNVIFKEGGVYLPEIGEIKIEGGDTKSKSFSHSKEKRGKSRSLVSVIAQRGNCTEEQALTVYNRWMEQVKVGDVFEIDGIAMVAENQFKVSSELEEKLNPKPKVEPKAPASPSKTQKAPESQKAKKEPQKQKKKKAPKKEKKKSPIWGVAATIAAIAVIGVAISGLLKTATKEVVAEQETAQTPQTLPELSEQRPVAPIEEPKQEQPKQEQAEPKAQPANKIVSKARYAERERVVDALQRATERATEEPKRFKVVCGVYSSQINAGRMALDIEYRVKGVDVTPTLYERGDSYMVVIFESNWVKECSQFINDVASKYYTTTWIFDQQRN